METTILTRLTTLGHPQRMAVFRLLMRRYPDAVPAGELARALSIKPSTLSVYLSALNAAGLVERRRSGTSLRYQARLPAAREIIDYLFLDCCRGRPQLCPPLGLAETGIAAPAPPRKPRVVFIGTGNWARSILAESILRQVAGARFDVYSAGTQPAAAPHPLALGLLRDRGHDVTGLRPKPLDEFTGAQAMPMDFVFTVCDLAANRESPPWPGQPISGHWGVADPARVTGSRAQKHRAFQTALAQLAARIDAFAALELERLDPAALQEQIDRIGSMIAPTENRDRSMTHGTV